MPLLFPFKAGGNFQEMLTIRGSNVVKEPITIVHAMIKQGYLFFSQYGHANMIKTILAWKLVN